MERLADYIHRIIELESEGKVCGVKSNHDPAKQDAGRDCSRERDTGGDRQDRRAYRQSVRQAERQD